MYIFLPHLQNCLLFKNKSVEQINSLLENIDFKVIQCHKGELLLNMESQASFLGIVLYGSVEVQRVFPDGKMLKVGGLFTAGQMFGGFIIFAQEPLYPVDVVAVENCQIMLISKENLLKLLTTDVEVLGGFLQSLSHRLLILHEQIAILSLNSISKKIAYYLVKTLEKQNSVSLVKLPFSKTTWAEYMNVSRTSLARELRQMSQDGLLSFDKRIIEVKNSYKLKELLGNSS